MNIAIGKSGRSCYFNKKRWSIFAGDDTPLILFRELCKLYPEHTFYLLGASDYQRCLKEESFKMPDNFVDVWGDMKTKVGDQYRNSGKHPWQLLKEHIDENGYKFDFGIILQGPDIGASIQGVGIKNIRDPNKEISTLEMGRNYVAPIQAIINDQKFPWVNVNEDPRYVPMANRDIVNDELCVLSQINHDCKARRITGYGDDSIKFRNHTLKYRYAGVERLFLNDLKKYDYSDPNHIDVDGTIYQKKNKFILIVNGGGDRTQFIEKWVLDHEPNQIIYGKWDDAEKEKHPNTFVEKGIVEINPEMWESKFTFIPAFQKRLPNFVTQKLWKMIYFGIIPFFDVNGYDTDHLEPIPDFCRVKTPNEMWNKINALDKNPEQYKKLLNYFYNLLEDKYFNGGFIKQIFNPFIEKFKK